MTNSRFRSTEWPFYGTKKGRRRSPRLTTPKRATQLEIERRSRARIEFARPSAKSVANARTSGKSLATVMAYGDNGADTNVLTPEGPRAEAWTRDDDGKPPAIDWLQAHTIEAVTAGFRNVLGFGTIQANASSRAGCASIPRSARTAPWVGVRRASRTAGSGRREGHRCGRGTLRGEPAAAPSRPPVMG